MFYIEDDNFLQQPQKEHIDKLMSEIDFPVYFMDHGLTGDGNGQFVHSMLKRPEGCKPEERFNSLYFDFFMFLERPVASIKISILSLLQGTFSILSKTFLVLDDFQLSTVDIVSDPSAPNAFVNGIMENSDWVCNNGVWTQYQIEKAQKFIKKTSKRQLDEAKLDVFKRFLNIIK